MIFDFQDPSEVTSASLREGLLALQELVPHSYAARCTEALDFCGDRMGGYLDADIEGTFSDAEVQQSVRSCAYTVPLTRKIVDRLSLLYKREPKRRVLSAQNADVAEAARVYHEIVSRGALSDALRGVHRLVNLLGLGFVQVGLSGGRIVFDVLSGKDVLLSPPADGRVAGIEDYDAAVLPKPYTIDGARVYAFWSARFHFLFDENGRIVEDFGDPELGNPLGAIPLIRLDREEGAELYPQPPESLVRANRRLNFAMTELFYTKKFQSFGQPVFVSDDDIQPDLKVGVQHLVHVVRRDAAASGDFRFESPDAPINEVKESVFDFLRLAARLHDVSPQSVDVSAVAESGVSKLISERDALEVRERDARLFRRAEGRIFELVCAFAGHYGNFADAPAERYGKALSLLDAKSLSLQVDYPEESPTLDPLTVIGRRNVENDFLGCDDGILREKRFIDLTHTNLASTDFHGGHFARANFGSAYLVNANFTGAMLQSAKFTKKANLERAVLDGADLSGCDLYEAEKLSYGTLRKAIGDEQTRLPGEFEDLEDANFWCLRDMLSSSLRPSHWPRRCGVSEEQLRSQFEKRASEIDQQLRQNLTTKSK